MTLQQLEYVMAVYRCKHFARAADYCDVTQPTLSSMIQKLEDELGIRIFDRRHKPIEPTKSGMAVIEEARKVLRNARRLKERVAEEQQSLSGTFNIGILPTVAPYLLPRFFPQLMNRHPDLDLRVTEMKTEDIKLALRRGDLDTGIISRVENLDETEIHTLFYEQFFAYVSKNDALFDISSIKTSDLTGEYLWLLEEGHCFSTQLIKFCDLKEANRSKRSYNLGSIETFMRIVESGKGVTFIPELATLQLNDNQRQLLKPFALPIPTREIIMITSPDFVRTALRDRLIDIIRESVPQHMLTLNRTQQRV